MNCHVILFIYTKKKKNEQAPYPFATDPVHIICMSEEVCITNAVTYQQ